MTTQIQLRGDTAANWESLNPVLAEREVGLDLTNNEIRIGDGETAWSTLPTLPSRALGENYALNHQSLREDYLRARGGPIGTDGVAAIALRFDHGLANFGTTILPMLTARQLPSSLAVNPSPTNMALPENAGYGWN